MRLADEHRRAELKSKTQFAMNTSDVYVRYEGCEIEKPDFKETDGMELWAIEQKAVCKART